MKKYTVTLLGAALLISLAVSAHARPPASSLESAQDPEKQAAQAQAATDRFKAIDANSDDVITAEEFKAYLPQMKDGVFKMIDSDGDAGIDIKEWLRFQEDHNRGMRAGQSMGQGMDTRNTTEEKGDILLTPPSR